MFGSVSYARCHMLGVMCKDDMLYICIFSNKFDLKRIKRVSHSCHGEKENCQNILQNVCQCGQFSLRPDQFAFTKMYYFVTVI
jgi:hypothetical protein